MANNCQRKLLLLISDYDDEERQLLVEYLKPISAAIKETTCGEETISCLQTEPFDCLITDYMLPDYDAATLIQDIKRLNIKIPIIVLTRNNDAQLAVDIMKAGAHDYIPKDKLNAEVLMRAVTSAMRLQKAAEGMNFYRDFFDSAPIGFYVTSLNDGTFLKANEQCVKMLGYRTFEQLTADVKATDLYSPERRSKLISMLKTWGQIGRFDIEMTLKDGTKRWFLVTAKLCEHACSQSDIEPCIRGSIMDVTEQKVLEIQLACRRKQELAGLKDLRKSIEMRLSATG